MSGLYSGPMNGIWGRAATIHRGGRLKHLGTFWHEDDAARAYDRAVRAKRQRRRRSAKRAGFAGGPAGSGGAGGGRRRVHDLHWRSG